jgi:hypothetical protein
MSERRGSDGSNSARARVPARSQNNSESFSGSIGCRSWTLAQVTLRDGRFIGIELAREVGEIRR